MTTIYQFEFDIDTKRVEVHFVDENKSIDNIEALAQIGHFHRRRWATESIQLMKSSDKLFWYNFPIRQNLDCPFGKRLFDEKWNNAAAFLIHAEHVTAFYICRSFIYLLYYKQYALNVTASS